MKKILSLILLLLLLLTGMVACDPSGAEQPPAEEGGSPAFDDGENYLFLHGNGGTSTLDPIPYETGAYVYIESTDETVCRPGYIFGGWNDRPDGSGEIKIPRSGDFTPESTGPLPLYAQWHKEYAIGEAGPGGGTIFYERINASSEPFWGYIEWLYLEVSPLEMQNALPWGPDLGEWYVGGTKASVGAGQENTELIIARLGDWKEHKYAAYWARFPLGADEDAQWFLPSRLERGILHDYVRLNDSENNLELHRLESDFYWSSQEGYEPTEHGNAFVHTFWLDKSGAQLNSHSKGTSHYVRPIRMF